MTPHPLPGVHGESPLAYEGWLVVTRELGHDPANRDGENYRRFDWTVLARLNHGYGSAGTIPIRQYYEDFSTRVAHYVEMSPGCTRWIIGNEPNHRQEWPEGMPITPDLYAQCFKLCRDKIKALQGHEADEVLLAAVAPWNVDTKYPGNEAGDWLRYFEDLQRLLGPDGLDGFALHAYVREQTPESVVDNARMSPPFEFAHWGFRVYMDWMAAILPSNQAKPVYITEFNVAGVPWVDANTGVIQAACAEIDGWNRLYPERPISCLAVYRWQYDQWAFYDKPGVIEDYMRAVARGYTVPADGDDGGEEEGEMLINPSFEQGWHNQDDKGILVLPDGWTAEYKEGGDPWFRPEIKPNIEFVMDGFYSIRAFPPEHSRGFFGIYQEVEVEVGKWYRFSADVRVESKPPGDLAAFVGIQPWGASIFERQMVWGLETLTQLEWQRIEVITQAFGGKIRVAMGATNKWATRNNTVWWDNAFLEEWTCEGGGTEPEPPEPPEPGECRALTEAQVRQIIREELPRWVFVPAELADVTED